MSYKAFEPRIEMEGLKLEVVAQMKLLGVTSILDGLTAVKC